jgi:hypothetical protein
MIKRLSAVVFGLVVAGGLGLAMAPSAQASAEATAPVRCIGNWVNAPCIGPEAKAPTMASRVVTPVAQPRVAQPRVAAHRAAWCTGPNPPLSAN